MKQILGIVLILVGLAGLTWGGITYTTKQKVLDVGPIHATRDKTHTLPLTPVAGGLVLIGGVVLLATSRRA
ncbi:MAG: DUF3185 domain-containing protein [Bryobacteraceae bacterium]|jgi:hypothetical protein